MKNILRKILLVGLLFGYISADDDWKFVCEPNELSFIADKRYFPAGGNDLFPLVFADSRTIQIDKKNKTIKVWTIWLSSQKGRDLMIQNLGKYGNHNNYGFHRYLLTLDYRNMRDKLISLMHMNCDGTGIFNEDGGNKWEQTAPGTLFEGITDEIMKKYNLK